MKITVKNKQSFNPIEVSFIIDDPDTYDDIKRAVREADMTGDTVTMTEWFTENETKNDLFIDELFRAIVEAKHEL